MKKILLISLVLILSLFITSCGEEKIEDKMDDKATNQEEIQNELSNQISEEISDDVKKISDKLANGEITSEEAEEAMLNSMNNSKTVQSQLEITKEQTPKMIEWIKVNKECIEDSDSKSDAEKCMDESNELAKKLGLNDFYIEEEDEDFDWNSEEKKLMLSDLNEGLEQMEKMLPCIEKAEVMTDLMQCGMDD